MELAFNRRWTADGSYGRKEPAMPVALGVAIGGALGALARYGLMSFVERRTLTVFPWDVFVVNISGCLLVGFVISALVDRHEAPAWLRVGLVLGFIGAYTTFSTFAQDLYDLRLEREYLLAALDLVGSVGLGVLAVAAGTWLGRLV
jgi:CrcB protein